jgi:hypothetical protein
MSIILFFIPGMLHISRSRLDKTKGGRIAKKAYKMAIESLLNSGSAEAVYISIHNSLNIFLNSKSNKFVERSSAEIISSIRKHINENKLPNKIKKILDRGDAVRFAPISNEESQNDINTIKQLLNELDQQW